MYSDGTTKIPASDVFVRLAFKPLFWFVYIERDYDRCVGTTDHLVLSVMTNGLTKGTQ